MIDVLFNFSELNSISPHTLFLN